MANKFKSRWVAKEGSIFVEEPTPQKFEFQKKAIPVQESIAFNVGKEVAQHIVNLHNAQLVKTTV